MVEFIKQKSGNQEKNTTGIENGRTYEIVKDRGDEQDDLGNSNIGAIKNEDQKRLQDIREQLKVNSDRAGEVEVFDPQKELLKIKAISGVDRKTKYESLEKYKNELGVQALGMGKINNFLEDEILAGEEIDLEVIHQKFEEKASEYKLSPWQTERYEKVFEKFREAMEQTEQEAKAYKDKSGKEIIKELNYSDCKGRIEIENHKIGWVFHVYDADDYAMLLASKRNTEELVNKDRQAANRSYGFYGFGSIFINVSVSENGGQAEETISHEMKHRINHLIDQGLSEFLYEEGGPEDFEEYFEIEMSESLYDAKDEILSYLKTGEDISNIRELLLAENTAYDYWNVENYLNLQKSDDINNLAERKILENHSKKEIIKEINTYKLRYEAIVKDGLDVVEALADCGFSEQEIIGILQVEPLEMWKKIYARFEKTPGFQEEKKRNMQKMILEYTKRIEDLQTEWTQYRKNNSWVMRKIQNLRQTLSSGLADKSSEESKNELLLKRELKIAQKKKAEVERAFKNYE